MSEEEPATSPQQSDEQATAAPDKNEDQPPQEDKPKNTEETKASEVEVKQLKEQFEAFAKFGDKAADGKSIKLSQSDKWFKQAKVIDGKTISTTDTGIAFRKISKNSPKLTFNDWNKYLAEISKSRKVDANDIKVKLVSCGKPGFTGATEVAKTAALDRLTDSSRYGGTHKQRFDQKGKGKGKQGREDCNVNDGFVTGSKKSE